MWKGTPLTIIKWASVHTYETWLSACIMRDSKGVSLVWISTLGGLCTPIIKRQFFVLEGILTFDVLGLDTEGGVGFSVQSLILSCCFILLFSLFDFFPKGLVVMVFCPFLLI